MGGVIGLVNKMLGGSDEVKKLEGPLLKIPDEPKLRPIEELKLRRF